MDESAAVSLIENLLRLPRSAKRALCVALDILALPAVLWLSLKLHTGDIFSSLPDSAWLYIAAPLTALPIFVRLGLYRAVHRYVNEKFFGVIAVAVTLHVSVLALIPELLSVSGPPGAVFISYWLMCVGYMAGSRWVARGALRRTLKSTQPSRRVIVYGAGAAGAELVDTLQKGSEYQPVAFIDDKGELHGSEILGLSIYPTHQMETLSVRLQARQVLLAIPSASRQRRRAVLEFLQTAGVHVKTVPALKDIVSGKLAVGDITEVDIDDLLGRPPVVPDERLLSRCVTGKSVLITGAAGSIGSELAREILQLGPLRLVLYEISEAGLYQIDRELRAYCHDNPQLGQVEILPILGTVLDEKKIQNILRTFDVETVYHAAAYKHVPLVESNPATGVYNNVFGTWRTARAALAARVETFILISTDKAVRPTSVMGASKRVAELILQGLAEQGQRPRFSMVRFGNVIGSSGSVVPLFKEQIAQGGPVTVTHPDIIRYFMTIPEAAQLVIQAGALGGNGDVYVLDMGEPVRIMDLACQMVALSGLKIRDADHPDGDIAIEVTGLRPGEKLYEELLIGDDVTPTKHPRILRAHEATVPWHQLMEVLDKLEAGCRKGDAELVRECLKQVVNGYRPQCGITDPIWRASYCVEDQARGVAANV